VLAWYGVTKKVYVTGTVEADPGDIRASRGHII
jgi:hypothetical protein